jgi:Domain of unknown function (DUF4328)
MSHSQLTKRLTALLKITIVVTIVSIIAGMYDYYLYTNVGPDVDLSKNPLPSEEMVGFITLLQLVLAITTAITFFRWVYLTNKNLRALSGEEMEFTPGWSVGWYFIPIFNLFKPYLGMKEIWKVSHKNPHENYSLVNWWWTLMITSKVIARLLLKYAPYGDEATEYTISSTTFVVTDILEVALNIVLLSLITKIAISYSKNISEPQYPNNE